MAGEDRRFWDDPKCIQCRALELLSNPGNYRAMIAESVEQGEPIARARQLLSESQVSLLVHEATLVGYRQGRMQLRAILLDEHECDGRHEANRRHTGQSVDVAELAQGPAHNEHA